MKLYNEEQLFNTVNAVRYYDVTYDEKIAQDKIEKHLKALQPIELPTEEEIDKAIFPYIDALAKAGFIEGAKWVIEQIKNK